MIFNSFQFAIFFPVVTTVFYLLPDRFKKKWLLLASVFFYGSLIPQYLLILFFLILVDFLAALHIKKTKDIIIKRLILILSILSTVFILVIFKYYNFFNSNLAVIASAFGFNYPLKLLDLVLPIGLSFHTFQSLSYVIEVYLGKIRPEKNLLIYALYVMFYPQLVAGPIERPQNLLKQLKKKYKFNYYQVTTGLKMMAWGLFKKVVLADRMAVLVNKVYGNYTSYDGFVLAVATVIFAFQIYCDFSGYSDIAVGTAKTLGINLSINFKYPYFSKTVSDFWHRWHISLSSWFRNYIYIPLGGNRVSYWRWVINITITFGLSGLWHGANMTYLVWGLINGLMIIFDRVTSSVMSKYNYNVNSVIFSGVSRISTFSLICFSWIFFRSNSVKDALYTVDRISSISFTNIVTFATVNYSKLGITSFDWLIIIVGILLLFTPLFLQDFDNFDVLKNITKMPTPVRWFLYAILTMSIIYLGKYSVGESSKFIYFQF